MKLSSLKFIALYLSLGLLQVYASGNAHEPHHASVTDLLPPIFNFLVLFSFIGWVLKKKLSASFKQKHADVVNFIERAEIRDREATVKLETYTQKLKNLEREISTIEQKAKADLVEYKQDQIHEVSRKIEKIKMDTSHRIESEKNAYVRGLNEQIVNSVIEKARKMIDKNQEYQQKISKKLLGVIEP